MNEISLNIYGADDEIIKTYSTQRIRWRLFIDAVKLGEDIESKSTVEQIESIGEFMKSIFIGLTDEDLVLADAGDVFNAFQMIVKKAKNIKAGSGKNG